MIVSMLTMLGLSIFFAGILFFANKKLKVEEDLKIEKINDLLPGVNCSACGCLSCHDFAENIVNKNIDPSACRVISDSNKQKICNIIGGKISNSIKKIAVIHCSSKTEHKKAIAEYKGVKSCRSANFVFGRGMECQYGCIGFGDCVNVCSFGALEIKNGLVEVDNEKCVGCGKCVDICPRKIITIEEKKEGKNFYVKCNSKDSILRVKQICSVGCIACKICERLSKGEIFKVENNLSTFNKENKNIKDDTVVELSEKCPVKVIKYI